jgi:N-acetylglucosamine kinase-like BadF-type ATPase
MHILIGDSGSTKTDWAYITEDNTKILTTKGLNPNHLTHNEIKEVLLNELGQQIDIHKTEKLYFYGAGLGNITAKVSLQTVFEEVFSSTQHISLAHDVLGAAQALFGDNEKGIVCILGTGSIAGYFNGQNIIRTTGGLGYLLGDEGSGTYMGKLLIAEYAQQKLPQHLEYALYEHIQVKSTEILHYLYKQPRPNHFLAPLTHFLVKFSEEQVVKKIIQNAFEDFYQRTLSYLLSLYPECTSIRCVGSVAYLFEKEFRAVMYSHGIGTDKIIQKPIHGIMEKLRKENF